jgi:phosphoglycolate phosphatase
LTCADDTRRPAPSAALFDLDGTLLNTLEDLADAGNAVLADMGFPLHPTDAYRYLVGDGVEVLGRRALPAEQVHDESLRHFVSEMRRVYAQCSTNKTRPYDGVPEMLDRFTEKGLPIAILSNKPDDSTKELVEALLPGRPFEVVQGARADVPRKPDPAAALQIAQRLGVPPADFLYLGDTGTDMRTASAAGMFAVGALWGFRDEKELREGGAQTLVKHPSDVTVLLD